MGQRITQVDAFTDRPFSGNPAAVCVLNGPADDRWMQSVAMEMNLSETAFVQPLRDAAGFNLRWFTPTVEVDLCGHATLATAHVLWEEGFLEPGRPARFQTRSGGLTATRGLEGIELDFPREAIGPDAPTEEHWRDIRAAIAAPIRSAGRNRFDFLVELEDEPTVRGLAPDIRRLERLPARGVIVTARASSSDYDFVSRFFAPRLGVDEDPVCGSAHCCLGPYWGEKLGRPRLTGRQVSPRGGTVGIRLEGPRVVLIGHAVTVLRGELD